MSRFAALLLCVLPVGAFACEVEIRNATEVDLLIPSGEGKALQVAPGGSARFDLKAPFSVDFGAVAHDYEVETAYHALCQRGDASPVQLIAQPDGTIRLDTPGQQPVGLPLLPIGVHDLTSAPSFRSFEPEQFGGSV